MEARFAAAVGLALFLWSCSGSKSNIRMVQDPSFTPTALRHGRVAVAGVTLNFGSEIDRATLRNQLAGILASALEWELSGLRATPVDVVRARLGRVRHGRLLADLEETGTFSAAAVAEFDSTSGADVRYAVAARIEAERVERDETTTAPVAVPGSPEKEAGDPERSTTRTLAVSFLVYELSGRRVVWSELIHGSHKETAVGHSDDQGKATYYPPYPAVPRLEWAFQDACRKLARHLNTPPK